VSCGSALAEIIFARHRHDRDWNVLRAQRSKPPPDFFSYLPELEGDGGAR
jgi:hypothetical protein